MQLGNYFILFLVRCRHAAISKFFGDEKPPCNKSCDFCENSTRAMQEFEDLCRGNYASTNSRRHQGRTGIAFESSDPDPDLYGGGRNGIKVSVFIIMIINT